MSSKKVIPISLLLTANALLVVLFIIFSNQWWWQRLAALDNRIVFAAQASEHSQNALLSLVNTTIPLNQLLTQGSLDTYHFTSELEFLLLDSSREYNNLLTAKKQLEDLLIKIEHAWPKDIDIKLFNTYEINVEIIIDIVDEVIDTNSPIQLHLLIEDLGETLHDLTSVMDLIEEQNSKLFLNAAEDVIKTSVVSKEHVINLEMIAQQTIKQSIVFMIFGGLFILCLQLGLYYILRHRLSGIAQIMTDITKGGSLNRRLPTSNRNDLIENIGGVFNSMLTRLEKSQHQLHEQIERAESATQAKSDFLANMSHEIRTPVHAITGIIHLMKEQQLTTKLKDYTDKAETASEALVHVINDVLDFSKISVGKIELENKPFELLPSLEKQIDLFSSKFNSKNLDLLLTFETDVPPRVIGDNLRLNQILINLINNALKFTHSGSVQINVSCKYLPQNEVCLTFAVQDTGIGIEQDRIPMLFDAFSQGDVTTTRKYGGTGLGLAISHKLSQLMGGDITVTSKIECGSSFNLSVRLSIDGTPNQQIFPILPSTDKEVLCVCAQGKQNQMLKNLLRTMGLKSTQVESLSQAQTMLLDSPHSKFGMVIIDVPSQQRTSIETLFEKVAEFDQLLTIPIVFISADKKKEDTVTAIKIIDRPIKPSELFNTVIGALDYPNELQFSFKNNKEEYLKVRKNIQQQITGAKILVVEDVLINQQIVREILNSGGLHVSLANNGKHALEILETEEFDLILMDLQMPVMGGMEATSLIRQQKRLENLPIIAITANVMKGVIENCIKNGFSDYLSKPLDVQKLWEMLGQWIAPADRTPFITNSELINDPEGIITLHDNFPGIDLSLGLERVNKNRVLYCSLIGDFLRGYHESTTRLQVLLDKKDLSEIVQLAHAIKGVTANLGISPLSAASHAIEKQAKRLINQDDINWVSETELYDDLFERFKTLFEQVAISIPLIITYFTTENNKSSTPKILKADIDISILMTSLLALKSMIDASDGEALDIFETIKQQINSSPDSYHILDLEEHLSCFDFEQASIVLEKILDNIKSTPSDINII